jgi:hypothetical protein
MNFTRLFPILLLTLAIACQTTPKDPNAQIDEGTVTGETYTSKELGWTIEIPKGYTVTAKDLAQAQQEKGLKMIEKATDNQVITDSLKQLIGFMKDKFNNFGSTSQPVQESYPGEYQENSKYLSTIIYQTFASQGIKADTATGKETIQGLEFNALYTKIYSPQGKVILNQIMLSRLHKGYDFGVNINYNNEEDKEILVKAFRNSKFQ